MESGREETAVSTSSAPYNHMVDMAGDAAAQTVQKTRRPRGTLDLVKCEDCRRRKVKCIPHGRRWPEKCDQCRRMNLACSLPRAADRTRKKGIQETHKTTAPCQQTILSTPDDSEIMETIKQSLESPVGAPESGIEYRDLRDAAVLLRLHTLEVIVKQRQGDWLYELLHPFGTGEFCGLSLIFNERWNLVDHRRALTSLQACLSLHITRLLKFPNMSLAERILLCQLLSDVNLADTTPYILQAPKFLNEEAGAKQLHTVELLSQSGDIGGAIFLLHSFLVKDCCWLDEGLAIEMLHRLGSELARRISEILDKLDIKLGSEEKRALGDPGVVILPFTIMPHFQICPNPWEEKFTRESLTWHWIRNSAMKAWNSEHLAACLDALRWKHSSHMDECGLEDIFGQSYLHVALLVAESDSSATEIVERVLSRGMDATSMGAMRLRQDGFTLLAYAAATGLKKTFAHLLGLWPVVTDPCMEDPYHKPMMLSAWRGDIDMIRLLLAVPDDTSERKQYRLQIAEDIARVNGKTAIATLLRSELEKGDLNLGLVSVESSSGVPSAP